MLRLKRKFYLVKNIVINFGEELARSNGGSRNYAVRIKEPLFEAFLPDSMLWKLAWGGTERIATGCTNGKEALSLMKGKN